ncbi:MAG TPA: 5-formyltetrahydrofolate cyclo-ligase [Fibrobacteria bacterium]|nr:5-formyltetrahydrofolate cyclo-ligase [Fibrobacteria bacterium]
MESFSSGEVLLIAVVSLLALDPKSAGKWWGKFRTLQKRFLDARSDLEREIRSTLEDEPSRRESAQDRLRSWARDRVASLGQSEFDAAPEQILSRLREWKGYAEHADVAAFWPLAREMPLKPLLEAILGANKNLWLPRIGAEPGRMEMVRVTDLDRDLDEGKWGLREPIGVPAGQVPADLLVLVPGEIFDLHGSRIGKGGGFYDRWLSAHPEAVRVGLCWDAQVHPGKLPQGAHDQPMDHLLTPARFVHFANGRTGERSKATADEPPEELDA